MAIVVFSIATCLAGCNSREDGWGHYISGGEYPLRQIALSPRGTTFFVSSPATGQGDLYAVPVQEGEPVRLTSSPAFETNPRLSFDGTTIAYESETSGITSIWVMDADGRRARCVTKPGLSYHLDGFWPDDKRLIVTQIRRTGGLGRSIDATELVEIEASTPPLPFRLGEVVRVVPGHPSDWFETRFDATSRTHRTWYVDAVAGTEQELGIGVVTDVAPGADAAVVHSHEKREFVVADRSGAIVARHPTGEGMVGPAFTPDGSGVVFAENYGRDVWQLRVQDGAKTRIETSVDQLWMLERSGDRMFGIGRTADRIGTVVRIEPSPWRIVPVLALSDLRRIGK